MAPPPSVRISAPIPTDYFAPTASPLAAFRSQFQSAYSHASSPIPSMFSPGAPVAETPTPQRVVSDTSNPIGWLLNHVRTGFLHYQAPGWYQRLFDFGGGQ